MQTFHVSISSPAEAKRSGKPEAEEDDDVAIKASSMSGRMHSKL